MQNRTGANSRRWYLHTFVSVHEQSPVWTLVFYTWVSISDALLTRCLDPTCCAEGSEHCHMNQKWRVIILFSFFLFASTNILRFSLVSFNRFLTRKRCASFYGWNFSREYSFFVVRKEFGWNWLAVGVFWNDACRSVRVCKFHHTRFVLSAKG